MIVIKYMRQFFQSKESFSKSSLRCRVVYLLWHDGVVVLKNEPLNVMGPETLLLHRLGLKQQALVI